MAAASAGGRLARGTRPGSDPAGGAAADLIESATLAVAPARPVQLRLPLLLIGQAGRSGGTLLLRLFDGHPACLVVPHELGPMLPRRLPHDPEAAFRTLTSPTVEEWHRLGVHIGKRRLSGGSRYSRPFGLEPGALRRLFALGMAAGPPVTDRDVLDRYLSAYFNAWRDGGPWGTLGQARWIVGFEPGVLANRGRMRRFDVSYPDGRVFAVVRDPWTWTASAQRWNRRFADLDTALAYWLRSTEAAVARLAADPERTFLLAFDDLILRTRRTMERVCRFLAIAFDERLLSPTLGGKPADANSSFGIESAGVSAAPVRERRAHLSATDERTVTSVAAATWDQVLGLVAS